MWLGWRAAALVAAAAFLIYSLLPFLTPDDHAPSEDQGSPSSVGARKGKAATAGAYPRLEAVERSSGARVWSVAELALHDGQDRNRPLLLAIVGEVYDVGPGARFYSPGEGYAEMAGKDASRAMSTGKFDVDAVPSLQGFSEQQVSDVMQWRSFYRQHEEYRFVGFLEGPYYAADGSLTPKLQSLEDTQAQTEKVSKTMAEARQRFKACNSKSKHGDDNTELWCDPGYHGPGTMPVYLTAYNPEAKKTESWCACASRRYEIWHWPRLFVGVPFTPHRGRRLLTAAWLSEEDRAEVQHELMRGLRAVSERSKCSMNIAFATEAENTLLDDDGFILRTARQAWWMNKQRLTQT
eukprot:s3113_g1.t1